MNRFPAVLAILASGLSLSAVAQAPAAPAAPAPHARVAIVSLQMAVAQSNEGRRDFANIEKKYGPRQAQLKAQSDEIDSLTKQLQAQNATLSQTERDSRGASINEKRKSLDSDVQKARSDFQQEVQDAYNGLAPKVYDVLADYAKQHGYTLILDVNPQDSPVLYAAQGIDITKQVIAAYNLKSGIPAPAGPVRAAPPTHTGTPAGH